MLPLPASFRAALLTGVLCVPALAYGQASDWPPSESATEDTGGDTAPPSRSAENDAEPSPLERNRGWDAGTIREQLDADPTMVPFGKGAIFVPSMTTGFDEPPVEVLLDGQKISEGTTGVRIVVDPGTYKVRIGSGAETQRFTFPVQVRELQTSVVPAKWSGLAIHIVDPRFNSLRGSYEIIRVDDREYIDIGFGTDEQAGETVRTWVLAPGLYKIVRVGETYRSRQDFVTVRLVEGKLTHFLLVLDEGTGEFEGGGEVPREEIFQPLKSALNFSTILGGDFSFASRQNVLGSPDGNSFAFRAFLDAKLTATLFGGPLVLRLQIEEGQTKSLEEPFQKTQDRADLDGLYVYKWLPWLGPYARFGAETNLVRGRQFFDEPSDIRVFGPDVDPIDFSLANAEATRVGQNRIRLSPSFGLTTIKEGAGLNLRVFKAIFAETWLRTGIGARHRITDNLFEPVNEEIDNSGPAPVPVVNFRRIPTTQLVGVEVTLLAQARLTRWVVANIELDSLIPFDDIDDIIIEAEGNIALKFTSFLSVNYVVRFLRDRNLTDDDRLSQDILIRFSWEVF